MCVFSSNLVFLSKKRFYYDIVRWLSFFIMPCECTLNLLRVHLFFNNTYRRRMVAVWVTSIYTTAAAILDRTREMWHQKFVQ